MKMPPKASELRFMTKDDGCVHVHPSSVNYTVREEIKSRGLVSNSDFEIHAP